MRTFSYGLLIGIGLAALGAAQAATTITSADFRLDLRESPRVSEGSEVLTYSALWDGASGSTVTIAQNGSTLVQNLVGEGDRAWSVNRNGTYTLTHTTYTGGTAGNVETATFVVTGRGSPDDVWYVDATNGVDTADGSSWATAKKTIQAALDLAEDGNLIIVTNGVYGSVATGNKSIAIRSMNGAENTVIDGGGSNRCFTCGGASYDFIAGFNPLGYTNSLICGFTLQNGTSRFGGASLEGTVEHCVITANSATEQGAGAYGGVLRNCLLVGNAAVSGGGGASKATLVNCTVVGNTSRVNIGGIFQSRLDNCIVAGNQGTQIGSYSESHSTFSSASYSNAKFADAANGDFRLAAGSPCIDAGDSALAAGATDLDGNPRIVGSAVDMGCYEVQETSLYGASISVALEGGPFIYNGTAQEPTAAVTNGAVGLVEGSDFSVSYTNNVNAGTAKAIVTGVGLYRGAVTNEFTINPRPLAIAADAKSKTYGAADPALSYTATGLVGSDRVTGALVRDAGEAIGTYAIRQGTLAAGDNYTISFTGANLTINPATIRYAASGSTGTYCGQGFGITVDVSTPSSGAAVQYATSASGPWQNAEIKYTNACAATPIWFKISAEGYTSVTNSRTVTIAPRQLDAEYVWLTLPPEDYVYDGTEKKPGHQCGDGDPSLITEDDFDVSFTDNVNAGTAMATFTGKRNYTGTVEEEFDILPRPLAVTAHPQRKTVGDADPPLRWSAPDLVAGDWLTGALVRDAGETVGSYAIRQGTLAASANYTMSFTGSTLTIVPEMAVTAVSFRQRYPWNGLVDVDVTFEGPDGENYSIELIAKDKAGGTNLVVRTVRLDDSAVATNPVAVPAPGSYRLVWDAGADLPQGFVNSRVTLSARLLNPIWSFESIPAVDPNDKWAPETVYHDVQTVVAHGEIENRTPTVRCLTDEWNLEDTLGANVVFSGSSMGLRIGSLHMESFGVYNPIALYAKSDSTNRYRFVTLDYETGVIAYDNTYPYNDGPRFTDTRFFTLKGDSRIYSVHARVGYHAVVKSSGTEVSYLHLGNRWGDDEVGSAVCSYFPKGIPYSDASQTTVLSALDKNTHAGIFFCGEAGTDRKQAVFLGGWPPMIATNSVYSCMGNPVGRYIVPLLDGNSFFTIACKDGLEFVTQHFRYATGRFDRHGDWSFVSMNAQKGWCIDIARSKAVAMPDGERVFFGGVGRSSNGRIRMWTSAANEAVWNNYPAGHPFESWARRDITCLLPNGKYCGVDEELGLVVVNPLNGEMYVASDNPVFKKGKMGCQLLPNGKVWIIPYDCEGREYLAGTDLCGKLYEVDFGFTRSFSLSSLCSPYLKVAEGDPEPSGIKVGLNPNGGELPGVYAQYYKGANPVYGTLPTPTRSGNTFRGWSTNGTEARIVAPTDPVPGGGVQLKAVWRAE